MFPVFVCLQLALPLCAAIAQQEGRPGRVQSEERRRADEKQAEERFREQRRPTERSVTEIDRIARGTDITRPRNPEFLDAEALGKLTKQDKLSIELIERRSEKGNYGLGSATHEQADRLGREWVGNDARLASDGRTLVSADKLRQYRPPEFKEDLGKQQANFEKRLDPRGPWSSNGHLDISE
jgi:hypothetical protein